MSSTKPPSQVMNSRDALLKKPSSEVSSSSIPNKTDKKRNLNSSRKPSSSIPKWHLRRGRWFNKKKTRLRQIKKNLTEIHDLLYRISNLISSTEPSSTDEFDTEWNVNSSTEPSSTEDFDEYSNLESSTVINNIDACEQLSYVALSLGPHSRNKLVYQLFMSGLVDQHPAAKRLVLAAKEQHEKFGDGANLVVSIAWKLLQGAKELITNDGLNPSQIIRAYNKATSKLGQILEALVEEGSETMDVRNKDQVIQRMKALVSSKLYPLHGQLCPLIAEACIQVCPKNPVNFNVDNVRLAKHLGASPHASKTFRGMVLKLDTVVGSIKRIENAQVLVIAGGVVDTTATETNVIHELGNYAKTEEAKVLELIKDSGAKVIVSRAGVGQMALQFCNLNEIMVLEIASQFELDCFCRTTDAVPLLKLGSTVGSSYLGHVDSILVEETPDSRVTVKNEKGGVATVLLGMSKSIDISDEQLQGDFVNLINSYKSLCSGRDSRIVPGAGATEIEIARRLKEFAFEEPGLSIAIAKYAESFELIPKTLAQNARLHVEGIIETLYADHAAGNVKVGVDLKNDGRKDASTLNIWDLYTTKYQALQYAADAVCNALRADQDQEPQSMFDRLMAEYHVSGQSIWQNVVRTKRLLGIFLESTWYINLQPKSEIEMLALKSHGDKLYRLSPDGMLSSIDICSSEVCWSLPANMALDVDFSYKNSDCSYFVDSSRVYLHTKETKPANFRHHIYEVCQNEKLFDEKVVLSRLVYEKYVDPVKGCLISPSRSDCDEILCIGVIYAQMVGYKRETGIILWYERYTTCSIRIVGREEGERIEKEEEGRRTPIPAARDMWGGRRC